MDKNKYSCFAVGITAIMLLGAILTKLTGIKEFLNNSSFNPLPLLWSAVALTILFILPRVHMPGRLRSQNQIWGIAFAGAVIFLALRFGAGFLLKSVALSPYDISFRGIGKNMLNIIPLIIAQETARFYVLGTASRYPRWFRLCVVGVTVIWCLFDISFFKITAIKSTEDWFVYIAKDVLPFFAKSCLLTALVLCGGARAGIIYTGGIEVFMYIFPFLPSLPWVAESALGISFPILMALFLWEWNKTITHKQAQHRQEKMGLFTVALVFTVAFAWFVAGVFPVYPSVILTGSMEPEIFPGDIVLIQKFSDEEEVYTLKENDVINFKREDITITHRINAVFYDENGNISFETKGDNNSTTDEILVMPKDLNGIITKVVDKAGLPVLWLQSNNIVPEGVVDN